VKIGIVTASPPGEFGVGQNYLRAMGSVLSGHDIFVAAWLRDPSHWREGDRLGCDGYACYGQRFESPKRFGVGKLGDWSGYAGLKFVAAPHARRTALRITRELEHRGVDRVLVVLESPQLILMAETLAKSFPGAIAALVWDHPEHVVSLFGHSGRNRAALMKSFHRSIGQSTGLLTVAEPLRDALAEINPAAASRVFRCPVEAERFGRLPCCDDSDVFRIGFAGSVTAPEELESLQRALDRLGWRVGERPIELNLFGKRFKLVSHAARNVRYHGFLPTQDDVIEGLSRCHLCYLPQPFAESRRWFAEYSFPTKASTYLASGVPILLHAPTTAALAKFAAKNQETADRSRFGFECNTHEPEQLARIIRDVASDRRVYEQGVLRARDTARLAFRQDEGSRAVHEALGLELSAPADGLPSARPGALEDAAAP